MRGIRWLSATLALAAASAVSAQVVTLNGQFGERGALLVIDGTPRSLKVGDRVQGVKLLAIGPTQAEIEVGGQRRTLISGTPVDVGGSARQASGTEILLPAGTGGHFYANGTINGRPARFVVDTGATSVAIAQADAERLGIDWKNAPTAMGHTANGTIVMRSVTLASVRIGDVEVFDVDGSVLPSPMPYVLLGNSFLARFQMKRENDLLVLERRY